MSEPRASFHMNELEHAMKLPLYCCSPQFNQNPQVQQDSSFCEFSREDTQHILLNVGQLCIQRLRGTGIWFIESPLLRNGGGTAPSGCRWGAANYKVSCCGQVCLGQGHTPSSHLSILIPLWRGLTNNSMKTITHKEHRNTHAQTKHELATVFISWR